MKYQTIFEIGPITHYMETSRKTADLWGASFLFSYLMGCVAKDITDEGGNIERPYLDDDALYKYIKGIGADTIDAGSIPDTIYCRYDDESLPEKIYSLFAGHLYDVQQKAETSLKKRTGKDLIVDSGTHNDSFIKKQLSQYFRLFWVTQERDSKQESSWQDLEKAINSRRAVYSFNSFKDVQNTTSKRNEKSTLNADYRRILTLKKTRRRNRDEQLSAICTIKRGLMFYLNDEGIVDLNSFASTTSIAADRVKPLLKNNYSELKDHIIQFINSYLSTYTTNMDNEIDILELNLLDSHKNEIDVLYYFPWEYYFNDTPTSIAFRKIIDQKCIIPEQDHVWLDSGYYAIVKTDGDDVGKLFGKANKQELSKAIAQYTKETASEIKTKNGQLIYSGGEDTLFIIHPKYIPELLSKLNAVFNNCLSTVTGISKDIPSTISAGVYICNHKHPLKWAVHGAEEMEREAKQVSGKGSSVIKLVKGSGEVCQVMFKNIINSDIYSLDEFDDLIKAFIKTSIPRGFVYKLRQDYPVFSNILENEKQLSGYIEETFSKTRDKGAVFGNELETLLQKSFQSNGNSGINYDSLIDRLYFARFLTGGK